MNREICEFCNASVKNKSVLKIHINNNKKCLAKRGLLLTTPHVCKGCNLSMVTITILKAHQETCKKFICKIIKDDFEIEKKQIEQKNKEYNDQQLQLLSLSHKNEINNIKKLMGEENSLLKNAIYEIEFKNKELKVRHEELKIRYDELSKQHEKTIEKLELKISQCDSFIQTLAREGSNKPTTTTNNTINNIRNHLSSTYTIDKLEPKTVEEIFREHYTEFDYYSGQKGLANFFLEKVIKTPDGKMMICCTDTSRKKFKILDMKGNLKEDIEARVLCEKLKVPTEVVTKEMYDKIITRIDEERDRLSRDDRSRKEKLIDDSMRAQQVFIDNMNFDDINYNQDFMHELCVLLNV
jgi:hypothetical protein